MKKHSKLNYKKRAKSRMTFNSATAIKQHVSTKTKF